MLSFMVLNHKRDSNHKLSKSRKRSLNSDRCCRRGIDIPNVTLVINYQMVKKFDEYIHRIGRTGRAGNLGESFTFISDQDTEIFTP